jgi:hypothetical protein
MNWSSRRARRALLGLVAAAWWLVSAAAASDVLGKASVNLQEVVLGRPFVLTVTLSGDLSALQGDPVFALPEGLHVSSQRQVTELSVGAAGVNRTLSFVYVMTPTKPGPITLGPFSIRRKDGPVTIQPIEVEVKKPRLPPFLPPQPRYTL